MMTKVDPAIWLPSLEIAWGILTLAFFRVQNVTQIYIMRAFVGAFEASAYPGTVTLLAAWYTPRELAFRISVYHSAQWGELPSVHPVHADRSQSVQWLVLSRPSHRVP